MEIEEYLALESDEGFVLRHHPNAVCRLECSTDHLKDWQGPDLYDYVVSVDDAWIGEFKLYPEEAWNSAREVIETDGL